MSRHRRLLAAALAILTSFALAPVHAQDSQTTNPAPADASTASQAEASKTIEAPKFQRLQVGMHTSEVQAVLGRVPDTFHTYESGKRLIPFYFGKDAVRMQAIYKGEGCLIFSVGFRYQNHGTEWKEVDGHLLEIAPDTSGKCYQP